MPKFKENPSPFMKGYTYPGTSPVRDTNPHTGDEGHMHDELTEKKPEGYYTVKDASNPLTETGQGKDVTAKYKVEGNRSTRDHIASGGKVLQMPDGSLSLTKTT